MRGCIFCICIELSTCFLESGNVASLTSTVKTTMEQFQLMEQSYLEKRTGVQALMGTCAHSVPQSPQSPSSASASSLHSSQG